MNTSRSSRLQMFFKKGVLKSFTNFTRKHLRWSFFLKNLQAEGLQLYKKRLQHRFFHVKFSYRTSPMTASAPPVAASVFLKRYSHGRLVLYWIQYKNSLKYKVGCICDVFHIFTWFTQSIKLFQFHYRTDAWKTWFIK